MRKDPRPFEKYRHFKGKDYQVITLAKDASDGRDIVVYQALYPPYQMFVRSLREFMSDVDRKKYPDVMQKERFALIKWDGEVAATYIKPEEPDTKEKSESKAEEVFEDEAKDIPDPNLIKFLDAETVEDKLSVLHEIGPMLTPQLLTPIELSLGMEPSEQSVDERLAFIKKTLVTRSQFEKDRLR